MSRHTNPHVMCGPECRYRALYEGAQSSLADLATKQAGVLKRLNRLREGLALIMRATSPRRFKALEKSIGIRMSEVDDETLLSCTQWIMEPARDETALAQLRAELAARGFPFAASATPEHLLEAVRAKPVTDNLHAVDTPTAPRDGLSAVQSNGERHGSTPPVTDSGQTSPPSRPAADLRTDPALLHLFDPAPTPTAPSDTSPSAQLPSPETTGGIAAATAAVSAASASTPSPKDSPTAGGSAHNNPGRGDDSAGEDTRRRRRRRSAKSASEPSSAAETDSSAHRGSSGQSGSDQSGEAARIDVPQQTAFTGNDPGTSNNPDISHSGSVFDEEPALDLNAALSALSDTSPDEGTANDSADFGFDDLDDIEPEHETHLDLTDTDAKPAVESPTMEDSHVAEAHADSGNEEPGSVPMPGSEPPRSVKTTPSLKPIVGVAPRREPTPVRKKRTPKVKATGPSDSSSPTAGTDALALIPRPVFMADIVAVLGDADAADDWVLSHRAGKREMFRFLAPKQRHRSRGSLVIPRPESRALIPGLDGSWWGRALDSFSGSQLYEMAVVLHSADDQIKSMTLVGDGSVVMLRLGTPRGVTGIILAAGSDMSPGSDTDEAFVEAMESFLDERLDLICVLAMTETLMGVIPTRVNDVAAQRAWKPTCPVAIARSWEWATGNAGAVSQIL